MKEKEMKVILISGVAGFIGSHLCETLLKCGHTVYGVDNFITGSSSNIEILKRYPNFVFHKADITKMDECYTLSLLPFDEIYHLASIASPYFYFQHPLETIDSNTIGLKNMLEMAKSCGAKLLYTSTSEVYGDPKVHPQSETYKGNVNCYGPRACYDESKRLGETYVYEYRRLFGVDAKIVRIFNTYGERMNPLDKRVIIEFIQNALQDKNLVIFGDGKQTRSFCYVSDLVRGLISVMEKNVDTPINLGNDQTEYTVNEVAQMIIQLTNSKSEVKHVDKMQDDPKVRKPDIGLAKKLLGWEPEVSLKEGLEKMIFAYQKM